MFATGKYYISGYKGKEPGLYLVLKIDSNSFISFYIPNVHSLSKNSRYIAIEGNNAESEHGAAIHSHMNGLVDSLDSTGNEIQSGELDILKKSRNKFELRLSESIYFNYSMRIVMLVPSWGRWTEKRLWLIITK